MQSCSLSLNSVLFFQQFLVESQSFVGLLLGLLQSRKRER